MKHQARLNAIYRRIEDSIVRESWREARQGLRELARLLVDATIASDNEQVALIDELVAQVFSDISLDDDFQSELTLNSVGWSADGLREVSQLARKRRPPMTSAQRALVLQDAETRILALLGEGNGGPRSNREIADRLELNVATVARTLGTLRTKGKVRSWPEGRFMMNELASSATAGLSMRVSNARALNQGAALSLDDAKDSAPRNPAPPQAPHSAVRMESRQQSAVVNDEFFRMKDIKTSLFRDGKLKKMIEIMTPQGIGALLEANVGGSASGSHVISNEGRPISVITTNPAPDLGGEFVKHHQLSA